MTTSMNTTNVAALALNGLKIDKEVRAAVGPGRYSVDTWVHVQGTVNVADDTMGKPTVSLPVLEILALFVKRAGITRESSMAILREVAGEAIGRTGKAAGSLAEEIDGVADTLDTIHKEVIARLPLVPRKGAVTVKLTVTEGGDQEAA